MSLNNLQIFLKDRLLIKTDYEKISLENVLSLSLSIYIYIYIYTGIIKYVPDFFRMGTFIDSTHMKV